MTADWRSLADAKRQSILDAIPTKWRIQTPVPSPSELRDVTGYIEQFLSPRELEITGNDAVDIATQTTSGNWTAVEVTEAFCHRAALAHQLVRLLATIMYAVY
jgi:amidase